MFLGLLQFPNPAPQYNNQWHLGPLAGKNKNLAALATSDPGRSVHQFINDRTKPTCALCTTSQDSKAYSGQVGGYRAYLTTSPV